MPDVFSIQAASLDDPSRFTPPMVTYAAHGVAWDCVDPALTVFETMPPM
jgi:hypothetical protein